jgi:hypothetical protein
MRYSVKGLALQRQPHTGRGKGNNTRDRTVGKGDRKERGPTSHNNRRKKKKQNQTGKERWRKKRLRLDERASCHHQYLRPTEKVDE